MAAAPPPERVVSGWWVRAMLAALVVSNAGTSLQLTAQAWLVWQTTHNLRDLGLLGHVQASPLLGLPLVGGLLADRRPRRSLLLLTQTTLAVVAAAMGRLIVAGIRAPLIILPCPARGYWRRSRRSTTRSGRSICPGWSGAPDGHAWWG